MDKDHYRVDGLYGVLDGKGNLAIVEIDENNGHLHSCYPTADEYRRMAVRRDRLVRCQAELEQLFVDALDFFGSDEAEKLPADWRGIHYRGYSAENRHFKHTMAKKASGSGLFHRVIADHDEARRYFLTKEPVDFTTNPLRDIPDQLATEPASSASIVPSGSSSLADADDISLTREGIVSATNTHQEELRCVITIVRHRDRTPKQKLKGVMHDEHFLRYFHNHTEKVKKDLKVKAKKDMVQFLETVKAVIWDMKVDGVEKNRAKLYKARHIRDILTRWKFSGLNRKLQMKSQKWAEEETADGDIATVCSELQLIVKWGGDLTKLSEKQAIRLDNRLRDELYPSNKDGDILAALHFPARSEDQNVG
ncbi:hypothetical protein ACHAWF_010620 [Thalassiosira exigua]